MLWDNMVEDSYSFVHKKIEREICTLLIKVIIYYSCLSQVFTKLATTHDINNTTNINIYKRKRRCLIAPPLSILNTNY